MEFKNICGYTKMLIFLLVGCFLVTHGHPGWGILALSISCGGINVTFNNGGEDE